MTWLIKFFPSLASFSFSTLRPYLLLGIFLVGGYLGYAMGSARADRVELRVAERAIADLQQMTAARDKVEELLTQEIHSIYKEIKHEKTITSDLRASNKRLLIAAQCKPSVASDDSVVGSGERAELDTTARQAYFDLREGIHRVEEKLRTCQGILSIVKRGVSCSYRN